MAISTPPTIDPVPSPSPARGDRTTFSSRVDAFVQWLITAVGQFTAIASNVYNNANDASASATAASVSAIAAAASASATKWVSGTTYADGAVVWSPLNYQTYRRKGAGAGTTDPSLDSSNWASLVVFTTGAFPGAVNIVTTTTFNVTANSAYDINLTTIGAACTGTLPLNPSIGTWVMFKDLKGKAQQFNITIARNGALIEGLAEDFIIDVNRANEMFEYVSAADGWVRK